MDPDAIGLVILSQILIVVMIFLAVWFIISLVANWKIFEKAGEPGWKCLIPFYNLYVEYSFTWIGGIGILYAVLVAVTSLFNPAIESETNSIITSIVSIASMVSFVISCMQRIRLAKAFGKGTGFGIGLIILEPIFRLILGFGDAEYIGNPEETSKNI